MSEGNNFIQEQVEEFARAGKEVVTRFPPEPNGYLHIGHAKAIVLNFELAARYGGRCFLRYDDTNPERESVEFARDIARDISWLGYTWDAVYYSSDYFERLYQYAVRLIKAGMAYVDHQSYEQIREQRGTPTAAGTESPFRGRSIEENMRHFQRMRDGEYADGECVLRAKIDMAHANLNMRDPTMYRIRHCTHHRTGVEWAIYPLYDYAHGQSDAIEGVSHSLCSLEFENHRPLYEWFIKAIGFKKEPRQIEFARLNVGYTILSKRYLQQLVEGGFVMGWDDPRLPTLSGMRRRGYPAEALCAFCRDLGITKMESLIDFAHLEYFVRGVLNRTAMRVMVVVKPIKLVIDNYPMEKREMVVAINNPEDDAAGTRTVPFGHELYIEADDFMEDAPKKYFRLSPGREVRLKHAYLVTCTEVHRHPDGSVKEVHCTYDPESAGGRAPDGRKVRGTLHWVSCADAVAITIHEYEPLFVVADVQSEIKMGKKLTEVLNPNSKRVIKQAMAEASLTEADGDTYYQFLRKGYYVVDRAADAAASANAGTHMATAPTADAATVPTTAVNVTTASTTADAAASANAGTHMATAPTADAATVPTTAVNVTTASTTADAAASANAGTHMATAPTADAAASSTTAVNVTTARTTVTTGESTEAEQDCGRALSPRVFNRVISLRDRWQKMQSSNPAS